MVKKIAMFFAYTLFFMFALMYFTPKDSIYFFLEKKLQEHDVIISKEKVSDKGFILSLEDADITYKSIESATIDKTNIKLFALYNSINIEGITLSSTAKSFAPLKIESVDAVYFVLNPLNATLHAIGEFGELDAEFDITKYSLHLKLKPSKVMLKNHRSTLRNLKKTKNGEFVYDKTF